MAERPILFSAPMVRAILEGRKTQTRRVVKPQPANGWEPESPPVLGRIMSPHPKRGRFGVFIRRGIGTDFPQTDLIPCPYGQPGDRLWVREAFSGPHCMDASDGCKAVPPSKWGDCSRIWYWADGNPTEGDWTRPRPSIHMPRWASRILLEITGVRIERLQDIGEEDALAEGVTFPMPVKPSRAERMARDAYADLWESINGPGSWDANPWAWVIEFRRIDHG